MDPVGIQGFQMGLKHSGDDPQKHRGCDGLKRHGLDRNRRTVQRPSESDDTKSISSAALDGVWISAAIFPINEASS